MGTAQDNRLLDERYARVLKTMGVPLFPFLCFTQDDTPAKIGQNLAAETVIDIISEIIWSTQVINR